MRAMNRNPKFFLITPFSFAENMCFILYQCQSTTRNYQRIEWIHEKSQIPHCQLWEIYYVIKQPKSKWYMGYVRKCSIWQCKLAWLLYTPLMDFCGSISTIWNIQSIRPPIIWNKIKHLVCRVVIYHRSRGHRDPSRWGGIEEISIQIKCIKTKRDSWLLRDRNSNRNSKGKLEWSRSEFPYLTHRMRLQSIPLKNIIHESMRDWLYCIRVSKGNEMRIFSEPPTIWLLCPMIWEDPQRNPGRCQSKQK